MKKTLIALSVIFAVLFILTSFGPFKTLIKNSRNTAPRITPLVRSTTSFSGKVEKIGGNKISVSQETSTPATYLVMVTDKTQINQSMQASVIPYSNNYHSSIKDIKIGQLIVIDTSIDLKTTTDNTFEATAIDLPPMVNMLKGQIIRLEKNILTIKGISIIIPLLPPNPEDPVPTSPQEKEYLITITPDTEIFRILFAAAPKPGEKPQPPKIDKLSSSDLKNSLRVTVYTAQDVNENSKLTALQIIESMTQPSL